MKQFLVPFAAVVLLAAAMSEAATLRICDWNMANKPNSATDDSETAGREELSMASEAATPAGPAGREPADVVVALSLGRAVVSAIAKHKLQSSEPPLHAVEARFVFAFADLARLRRRSAARVPMATKAQLAGSGMAEVN